MEERIADTFSLPKDMVMGLFEIHVIGNKECIVENYRGIKECSEECICIQGKKQLLTIQGSKLTINYYTESDMKICGFIHSITFQ